MDYNKLAEDLKIAKTLASKVAKGEFCYDIDKGITNANKLVLRLPRATSRKVGEALRKANYNISECRKADWNGPCFIIYIGDWTDKESSRCAIEAAQKYMQDQGYVTEIRYAGDYGAATKS